VVSSASAYGISLASKGTITNSGTISGNDGVGLRAGGTVTNNGSISASGAVGGGLSVGSGVVISGSAGDLLVQGGLAADLALLWLLGSAFRTAYRGQSAGLVTLLCGITLFGMTNLIIRQPLFWFFIDDPGPINEHGGEEDVANCAQGYDEGRASFMSRHGHQEDLGSGTGCCSNIRYSTTRTAGVYNATTRRWRMRPR
jgi:hypothetical protein